MAAVYEKTIRVKRDAVTFCYLLEVAEEDDGSYVSRTYRLDEDDEYVLENSEFITMEKFKEYIKDMVPVPAE
jgi:hypothetical protein